MRTWSGNKKSHPVQKIFTSANGESPDVTKLAQYNTAPLEPQAASWAAQTGISSISTLKFYLIPVRLKKSVYRCMTYL